MEPIAALLTSYRLYKIPGVIFSGLILLLILRRPRWLAGRWQESVFIAAVTFIGSFYLLFTPEKMEFFDYTALSFLLSVAGAGLSYAYRRQPIRAFQIACLSFVVLVWSLFSYTMLRDPGLIRFDERYYLSIAATASGGHGLYPALQNYSPMPVMGGIGHLAWIYVLAYQILGPSIHSLRLVALVFNFLSLPAIFLLFRRWYGPVTAWVAVAIIPTTLLQITILSARMDIFTVTALWWALLLVDVAREKNSWRWHLATGLYLGLCLQAHIHTSIMAIAIGLLYLVDYGRQVRQTGRWVFPWAVIAYSAGALIGLGFFVVANILPDSEAFFRTAGNAGRFSVVSVNAEIPPIERLVKSLTAVSVFWKNFVGRVEIILKFIHPVELILWIAAFLSLFWRRAHKATLTTIILSISVVVVGFFILNNQSLAYTAHIGTALLLCVPPFFTYGFGRQVSFGWEDLTPSLVLVLSACVFPIYMTTSLLSDIGSTRVDWPEPLVTHIKGHISTQCHIIGPDELFAFHLPMYSMYHSGEDISSGPGRRYYNDKSDVEIWQSLDPDIAIVTDPVLEPLESWVQEMKYEEIFPSVWKKTQSTLSPDCVIIP